MLQQLTSAYTESNKRTVENHLKFVSARHRMRQQVSVGDVSSRTASSVDSITDYNGYSILLHRSCPV